MKIWRLLLLLTGCSLGPTPDLVSSHGVSFFWKGSSWSLEQINEQENWFIDQLDPLSNGYKRFDTQPDMRNVVVYVYGDKIPCGRSSQTGFCNGLQDYNILYVRDMGCVFNSAYTHELMHWFQQSLKSYTDYDHGEQNIWPIADGAPHGCI